MIPLGHRPRIGRKICSSAGDERFKFVTVVVEVCGVLRADGEAHGSNSSAAARSWRPHDSTCQGAGTLCTRLAPWWSRGDSNPGHPPCKGGALPAELRPPGRGNTRVGAPGLEPGASALSGPRSDRLSYAPGQRAHRMGIPHTNARPQPGNQPGDVSPRRRRSRHARFCVEPFQPALRYSSDRCPAPLPAALPPKGEQPGAGARTPTSLE